MNAAIKKALEIMLGVKVTVEDELAKLEADRERLKQELDLVINLPRSKDEVIADFERAIDQQQRMYVERLTEKVLGSLEMTARRGVALSAPDFIMKERGAEFLVRWLLEANPEADTPGANLSATLVAGLFAGILKPRIRELITAMPWPEQVGLPAHDRQAKVAELNREIATLSRKIKEILDDARSAGIDV